MAKTDWTGQKFFYITLLHRLPNREENKRWRWEAQCECGKTLLVYPDQVKKGSIKSCGCKKITTAKDWTGQTFYNLTFIAVAGKTATNKIKWKAQCTCGRIIEKVPHDIVSGKTKTCGKCIKRSYSKNWDGIRHGGHTIDNVVPCCWECNESKKNKTPSQFIEHAKRIVLHQGS